MKDTARMKQARQYADKAVRRKGNSASWITLYMKRYRMLAGLPLSTGPVNRSYRSAA